MRSSFRRRLPARSLPAVTLLIALVAPVSACSGEERAAGEAEANQRRFEAVLLIFDELRREPLIKGHDVKINAEGGGIVLRGTLPSEAAHRRVLEIARPHLGGLPLRDSLVVAGAGPAGPPAAEGR